MKMILMPADRFRSQAPPDIELKLLQQSQARKQKLPKVKTMKNIYARDSLKTATSKVQKGKTRELLKHLNENNDRLVYDNHTGEIEYSGIKAADSDVRDLIDSFTTSRKQTIRPKGWDLFIQALEGTGVPKEIFP